MAYKKPLVTTTVYYHGGENTVVFADSISNGKTMRYGSTVREQLLKEETVDSIGAIDGGEPTNYVIPYHAVIYAEVIVNESDEQTAPEDDFCGNGGK